ncbi:uncharacterized protein BYT42DRAFT_88709 [Radiomyces spectabilis]|uniref:uncharacterized protein n=1 Tax=Radiomyces spectabilis TaxID=64574 RepID=UPI00221FCB4C|nr:uncharacterized protein BYT42DRAFT_88709 [Radiomyces spectabilis]KAI8370437.1 hypothetical protein BYT42DRAFT_88709 [Radiomyces spectabilis]
MVPSRAPSSNSLPTHERNLKAYEKFAQKYGVCPAFPITVPKLLKFIKIKSQTNSYRSVQWLMTGLQLHPTHSPSWFNDVGHHASVLELLADIRRTEQQLGAPRSRKTLGANTTMAPSWANGHACHVVQGPKAKGFVVCDSASPPDLKTIKPSTTVSPLRRSRKLTGATLLTKPVVDLSPSNSTEPIGLKTQRVRFPKTTTVSIVLEP